MLKERTWAALDLEATACLTVERSTPPAHTGFTDGESWWSPNFVALGTVSVCARVSRRCVWTEQVYQDDQHLEERAEAANFRDSCPAAGPVRLGAAAHVTHVTRSGRGVERDVEQIRGVAWQTPACLPQEMYQLPAADRGGVHAVPVLG